MNVLGLAFGVDFAGPSGSGGAASGVAPAFANGDPSLSSSGNLAAPVTDDVLTVVVGTTPTGDPTPDLAYQWQERTNQGIGPDRVETTDTMTVPGDGFVEGVTAAAATLDLDFSTCRNKWTLTLNDNPFEQPLADQVSPATLSVSGWTYEQLTSTTGRLTKDSTGEGNTASTSVVQPAGVPTVASFIDGDGAGQHATAILSFALYGGGEWVLLIDGVAWLQPATTSAMPPATMNLPAEWVYDGSGTLGYTVDDSSGHLVSPVTEYTAPSPTFTDGVTGVVAQQKSYRCKVTLSNGVSPDAIGYTDWSGDQTA